MIQTYDKLDCNSKTHLSFTPYLLIKGCENPGYLNENSQICLMTIKLF